MKRGAVSLAAQLLLLACLSSSISFKPVVGEAVDGFCRLPPPETASNLPQDSRVSTYCDPLLCKDLVSLLLEIKSLPELPDDPTKGQGAIIAPLDGVMSLRPSDGSSRLMEADDEFPGKMFRMRRNVETRGKVFYPMRGKRGGSTGSSS